MKANLNGKVYGEIRQAKSFFSRLKGLMFDRDIADEQGLLIESCKSIHTCFMNFSIDVVFIDSQDRVVKVIRALRPWRMSWYYLKASKVLEVKANSLPQSIMSGDRVEFSNV